MLLLTSTSDKLQVITSAAVTVDVHADWVDNLSGAITPGRTNTAITTATTTDVVASPAASTQRNIQAVSIANKHASTANTVTVQHTDGTTVVLVMKVTLAAGERLQYEDADGWSMRDAAGNIKSGLTPSTGLWRQIVNVIDYGALGNGSTDDKLAIQNAINAAGALGVSARGVDVWFPAGIYALSGPLTCNFNNVTLRGSGWQSTVLYCTITTGDVLQFGDGAASLGGCGLTDMSVWKSAAGTTGSNINVNKMNDVTIRNFVVNNPFNGITVQGASIKVWIENGEINNIGVTTGVGIQVTNGAAGDTYVGNIVMSNNPASKPAAGIQITQTGHMRIWGCNITSCIKGLSVNPGAAQDVNYLFIDDSLFDSCGTHGAQFSPTNATGRIRSVISVNSWYAGTVTTGAATNGIEIGPGTASSTVDGLSFIGCRVLNNQRHGIGITYASANNVSFTDCTVTGNGAETVNTYDAVNIVANVNNVSLVNCGLGQAGTAGNQQRFAVNIAAGTSANIQVVACQLAPNGTVGSLGSYLQIGTLTGGGNVFDGNQPGASKSMSNTTVAASAGINTTETVISGALRFAANAFRPGTTVRFHVGGSCTITTAAAVPTFRVRLGTAGTTGDTAVMTFTLPTSGGVGTSVFHAIIDVTCRTLGAAATFAGTISVVQASATLGLLATNGTAVVGTAATGVTTNANFITCTYQGASANVTCTFQQVTTEVAVP